MKGPTWYADGAARATHAAFQAGMANMLSQLMPGYELSHMGVERRPQRDPGERDEVLLTLHLNPIGAMKVRPEATPGLRRISE